MGSPRVPFDDELRARTGGVRVIRAFIFDLDGTLVETEELNGLRRKGSKHAKTWWVSRARR